MFWGRSPLRIAVLRAVLILLPALATASPAYADSYASGLEAYGRGEYAEALRILKPLAEQGDARAQYGLGKIYETGGGQIAADEAVAAAWYRKSAVQGLPAAQNNLALMYAQGRGVPQDKPQAYTLWEAAARGGHPHAQYNMALLFYRGEGVERDPSEAARWFGVAAENGLAEAQFAVAEMHRLGLALSQDNRRALGWYALAEAQGHESARLRATRLRESGVTPVKVQGSFDMPPERVAAQASAPAPTPAPTPAPAAASAPATTAPQASASRIAVPQAAIPQAAAPAPKTSEPAVMEVAESAPPATQAASAGIAAIAPASGGAYSIWLMSMSEDAGARRMTEELADRYGPALGGAELVVRPVDVSGSGVFYRVVAGSWSSSSDARSVCEALRRDDPAAFCKVLQD